MFYPAACAVIIIIMTVQTILNELANLGLCSLPHNLALELVWRVTLLQLQRIVFVR